MKNNSIAVPAFVLFFITFVVGNLMTYAPFSAGAIISSCVTCLITEVFAYVSWWALVFRKNKGMRATWINYIVWIVLLNLGNVATLLGY